MANTSDGGKGDTPDPSNANINTDALSISTPAAHSHKNILVLTGIDPFTLTMTVKMPSTPPTLQFRQRCTHPRLLAQSAPQLPLSPLQQHIAPKTFWFRPKLTQILSFLFTLKKMMMPPTPPTLRFRQHCTHPRLLARSAPQPPPCPLSLLTHKAKTFQFPPKSNQF